MSGFGDHTRTHTGPPLVQIQPNSRDEAIMTGSARPCIFTAERSWSSNILVDSKDRIYSSDSPFNFSIDLGANLFRPRSVSVQKVTIPLINNVNPLNNVITVYVSDNAGGRDVLTVTLQPAVYDPISLANEIVTRLNVAVAASAVVFAGVFACGFNKITQLFTLFGTHTDFQFKLDNACSFIQKGRFLHGFTGTVNPSIADADATFYQMIRGGRAAMMYTRYITIHSARLNQTAFSGSRTSDPQQGKDIVAVVDITGLYGPEDFNTAIDFSGAYKTVITAEAPNISVLNGEKNLTQFIDFRMKDEYGFGLDASMASVIIPDPAVPDPARTYNGANTLEVSLWLEVFF